MAPKAGSETNCAFRELLNVSNLKVTASFKQFKSKVLALVKRCAQHFGMWTYPK